MPQTASAVSRQKMLWGRRRGCGTNGFALAYSITSSAREPRRGDAERLLSLEVDHQLGLRRLLNGQVHPY